MSNAALAGFNLGSKLSAISALTGKQTGNDTTIENLSSDVRYAPDGTRLDKINLVIPSLGTVTGAGTISPSNALDFKMLANLAGVGAGLTKAVGMGAGGIPIDIGGTTSNPSFMPDMKGMVGNQLKGLMPWGQEQSLGRIGRAFRKEEATAIADRVGGGGASPRPRRGEAPLPHGLQRTPRSARLPRAALRASSCRSGWWRLRSRPRLTVLIIR